MINKKILGVRRCTTLHRSSINSLYIVLLFIIFLSSNVFAQSPGGISTNLNLWLKADAGTYETAGTSNPTEDADTLFNWTDQSGSGNDATQVDAPTFNAIDNNYNPSIYLDGALNYMTLDDPTLLPLGASNRSYFFVSNTNDSATGGIFYHGTEATAEKIQIQVDGSKFNINFSGHKVGDDSEGTIGTIMSSFHLATANTQDITIYKNNDQITSGTLSGVNQTINTTSTNAEIGRRANGKEYAGNINEIIIYDDDVSAVNQQKIETYLAIKWGITMGTDNDNNATPFVEGNGNGINEGDYVDTDGTVIWDGNNNQTYHFDVAGIGRDDTEALSQIKSKSENTDAIVTIWADGEGSSNTLTDITWVAMANKEYFIWGNNDGAITMTATNAPANCQKITRTWYVQESSDVGTFTFTVDVDDADFDVPTLTCGATSYVLMYDSDVDLAGGTIVTLYDDGTTAGDVTGSDGIWTNNTINLATGTFFSIGQKDEFNWTGDGADDNWTTDDNWLYDIAPEEGNALVFAGATRTTPSNDFTAGTDFASISFENGASSFTLSGNAVTITTATGCATISIEASNATNTMTIGNNITFSTNAPTITSTSGGILNITGTIDNGGLLITNTCGGTSEFSGVISGSGAFTKNSAGALTLSATNTFTGGLTLSAGTLNINDAQALGTSAGTFTIAGGTTIDASGGAVDMSATDNPIAWNGDVTFTGTNNLDLGEGAVTMDASRQVTATANTLTIGGVIGDGASGYTLTKAGAGALTLSGTNTFSGGVTLSAGTLNIDNAQALGTSAGTFTIAGGTTIDASLGAVDMSATDNPIAWNGDVTFTGTNNLDLGEGVVTIGANRQVTASANTLTIGGVIGGGAYTVTKAGAGALTLTGTNTITGGVTLAAGTLNIGNAQALGTSAGIFTIADGTTINTSGGAIDMSATDNPMTWSGNFTFTGTNNLDLGDGTITMAASRIVTTSGSVLTVGGTLSSAANDLTSAGAGELAFVAQAVTLNDINITAGTLTSTSGVLSIAGDFDNDATFTHNNGTVTFNGTVDQNLGTSAGTQTFYNLVINNTGASASDDIVLADPVTVTNVVTLTDGIVNTDATNLLTLSNTATGAISGGSAGTFVSGPLSWDLTTGTTYTLPVGVAPSTWMRLGLSALTGATNFTVEYFFGDYGDATVTGGLSNASQIEYWDVTEVDAAVDADVTLYWENATTSDINSCAAAGDLVVAHYDGADWESFGNAGGVTGTCTGGDNGTVKATGVTSFSPFTFGSNSGGLNPLPIELLSFTATYNGVSVDLNWETASEINNDFFTIERSIDGINFEIIEDFIASKAENGNSSSLLIYEIEDIDVSIGVYYYRLKQTDFDGQFEYSSIQNINIHSPDVFDINISPNPSDGNTLLFFINVNKGDNVQLDIVDVLGQKIFNTAIEIESTEGLTYPIELAGQLAVGIYFVVARIGEYAVTHRIVIH